MPIYEYQCQACQHAFETIQSISEPVLTECPDCGRDELKKLVSAAAFRLKGSGWYETDFKSSKQKNVSKDDKPSESGSGKSDSKETAKSSTSDAASKSSGSDTKTTSS
jgi:putative FmdB family regulatory protein